MYEGKLKFAEGEEQDLKVVILDGQIIESRTHDKAVVKGCVLGMQGTRLRHRYFKCLTGGSRDVFVTPIAPTRAIVIVDSNILFIRK